MVEVDAPPNAVEYNRGERGSARGEDAAMTNDGSGSKARPTRTRRRHSRREERRSGIPSPVGRRECKDATAGLRDVMAKCALRRRGYGEDPFRSTAAAAVLRD